jgi:hypothetical protein
MQRAAFSSMDFDLTSPHKKNEMSPMCSFAKISAKDCIDAEESAIKHNTSIHKYSEITEEFKN